MGVYYIVIVKIKLIPISLIYATIKTFNYHQDT